MQQGRGDAQFGASPLASVFGGPLETLAGAPINAANFVVMAPLIPVSSRVWLDPGRQTRVDVSTMPEAEE